MEYGSSNQGSGEYGEKFKHDPSFDGVDRERKCTDICMCIFFFLFICGMIAILVVSAVKGDPKYFFVPTDHRGLMCGYNNQLLNVENASDLPDLTDKPALFWVRPGVKGYARSFCVAECPNEGLYTYAFKANLQMQSKKYHGYNADDMGVCAKWNATTNSTTPIAPAIENYSTTDPDRYFCGYATEEHFSRCLPVTAAFDDIRGDVTQTMNYLANVSQSIDSVSAVVRAIQDLYNTYWIIAVCVVIALVLSLVWLFLLRCCAAVFVWITVVLTAAALAFLTYMCYHQSKNNFDNAQLIAGITLGIYSEELNRKVFNVFFYILLVLDIIFVLVLLFMIKRIVYSINVIKTVSQMFYSVPSLFFFPIAQYIILFVWWIYVIAVAIVLFGAGTPTRGIVQLDSSDPISTADVISMQYDTVIQGFSIYHFIGFLWVSCFIMALGEMTVAGVVAEYYFASDDERNNMPKFICTRSLLRSLRYHTGTLAVGSLIITICKIIRAIIQFIEQKTRESQNTAVKCIVKCLKCCFCCLEKFLKYLNRNAYIMTAMHGFSFFKASKEAFFLLLRNAARATALNWVGDFTLFLGRILISALVSGISILIFKDQDDVTFYIVPAVIVLIMSYLASGAFTGVFEMSIDATFLCFLEDEERNDGGPGARRHTPDEMKQYLNDNNLNA
ncbi:choline transporter-like protein 2 isoform X3 [Histomonas meleagridis]|uniref:choline transporter-like protein 2 isoform X3 n=1 Tax=Histomonas meleagridis TaxID=135588 RepID=UPI0035596E7B|nr:choline transporter-like protein 2 isoform X3 [Histomonas meleagridis]KAH0800007.1 choline transporter-like protein 2 isoform X3 [Histomonas meleagridis]